MISSVSPASRRTRVAGMLVAAIALCVSSACTSNRPWRTWDPEPASGWKPTAGARAACELEKKPLAYYLELASPVDLSDEKLAKRAACYAAEQYTDAGRTYSMHTIEFDDQGQLWNPESAGRTLGTIGRIADTDGALIIAFAHGWFNNAAVCNDKVCCFRETLNLFSKIEQRVAARRGVQPRQVVGVLLGWRGQAFSVPVLKLATFWGRKSGAHRVGDNGAVARVVGQLGRIRTHGKEHNSELVIIGHSFGGAVLVSAMGNLLTGEVDIPDPDSTDPPGQPGRIDGVGTMVFLLNPALEASRYHLLHEVSTSGLFNTKQTPVLVTVTSERDVPNILAFPLGQSLAAVSRSGRSRDQWQSMIQSIGTYQPYQTHRLSAQGELPQALKPSKGGSCGCAYQYDAMADGLVSRVMALSSKGENPAAGDLREFLYSRLEPIQDIDKGAPYIVVRADGGVMGDHGDIFNPRLVAFLSEFYTMRYRPSPSTVKQGAVR